MHATGTHSRSSPERDIHTCAVDDEDRHDVKGATVLIIDDDQGTRQTFERVLRLAGATARTAETAMAGLDLATEERFDVILVDLRLPDLLGIDLIAQLAAAGAGPAVLISAFLTIQTAVEAMKRGAFDVAEKPIEIDDLLSIVGRAATAGRRSQSTSSEQSQAGPTPRAPRSVAERFVVYVTKVCNSNTADAEGDFRTLQEWARRVAVSYSTLCETCALLGLRPRDARDFARVLNALTKAAALDCAPEVLLDVSNRRVLRSLSGRAGVDLEVKPNERAIATFFDLQSFLQQDHEVLRLIRARFWRG